MDCVLFRYSPFSSLSVTTVLINCCSCCSDSAKITVSSAYLRLLTTLPPIRNHYMSSISLIIISVYNANKCGDATQPCRTPYLMLIHSLRSLSHRTAALRVQYRFVRSRVSASSTSSDCSSSTNESCLTVSKALL